jgi:inorganic pyrophosphatase
MRDPTEIPLSAGEGAVHAVVESPAGSTAKLKWEPPLGLFSLARPLPLGMSYPHDWGFLPGTRGADGDPLDVLVLSEATTYPGLVLPARPVAVLRLEQNRSGSPGRERNDRLIAVPRSAARNDVSDLGDLPARLREELERFFVNAVFFQPKDPRLLGWGGQQDAWALIRSSLIRPETEPGGAP